MTKLEYWSAISRGPDGEETFYLRSGHAPGRYISFHASSRSFSEIKYLVRGYTTLPADLKTLPPEAVAEALAYALTRGRQ